MWSPSCTILSESIQRNFADLNTVAEEKKTKINVKLGKSVEMTNLEEGVSYHEPEHLETQIGKPNSVAIVLVCKTKGLSKN